MFSNSLAPFALSNVLAFFEPLGLLLVFRFSCHSRHLLRFLSLSIGLLVVLKFPSLFRAAFLFVLKFSSLFRSVCSLFADSLVSIEQFAPCVLKLSSVFISVCSFLLKFFSFFVCFAHCSQIL